MKVIDLEKSEHGPQRKRGAGRLLHCCCICGKLDTWGNNWSGYYSMRELDDEVPIPKFCSEVCRESGGAAAKNVTRAMKQKAKDAEWREPTTAYREATEREKYNAAFRTQRT